MRQQSHRHAARDSHLGRSFVLRRRLRLLPRIVVWQRLLLEYRRARSRRSPIGLLVPHRRRDLTVRPLARCWRRDLGGGRRCRRLGCARFRGIRNQRAPTLTRASVGPSVGGARVRDVVVLVGKASRQRRRRLFARCGDRCRNRRRRRGDSGHVVLLRILAGGRRPEQGQRQSEPEVRSSPAGSFHHLSNLKLRLTGSNCTYRLGCIAIGNSPISSSRASLSAMSAVHRAPSRRRCRAPPRRRRCSRCGWRRSFRFARSRPSSAPSSSGCRAGRCSSPRR